MGRGHTFMDREFGRPGFDPSDAGTFDRGLVFVIMPFSGTEADEAYEAIRDECRVHHLRPDTRGAQRLLRTRICPWCRNEATDILLIARHGTVPHFDIAPLRLNFYTGIPQLRSVVSSGLTAMIKATRHG